jgi:transcriptional regulator with XRE-family HTH domain
MTIEKNKRNTTRKAKIKDSVIDVRLDPITGKEYGIQYEDVFKVPLAKRLKILRQSLNLDQKEIGLLLDISPRTISKLENNQAELTIKHREKYLELFSKHPDGKSLLYYADDQLSEAFAKNILLMNAHRSVFVRRIYEKITEHFVSFNAQAKQALESYLNFIITQSVGSKNIKDVPEFSDSVIALRSTTGWGFGTFEMHAGLEPLLNDVIKVPYNRMRIVRGLGYELPSSKDLKFNYEIFTTGALQGASNYLDSFDWRFVTDNSIESPFIFLAKGNDWSDAITFKKQYGFLGRMLNKMLYPLRKILGTTIDGARISHGFHSMTTAGVKLVTAKDRKLTIMFHYDSYKDVEGKQYSKEDFQDLVDKDLDKMIPIIRDWYVQHEVSDRSDPAINTIRARSMQPTSKEIVAKMHGIPVTKEGWRRG